MLSGAKSSRCIVELEPLFACNLKCEGCGKIQHPAGLLKQRMPVEQAVGAVLECGRPDGLDRGRRAAHAPADRRDRPPAGATASKYRLPVHQRGAAAQEVRQVHAVAVLRVDRAYRRAAGAARRVGRARKASSTRRSRRSRRPSARGFRVTTNSTFFNTDTPQNVIEVLDYLNDDLEVDEMMISPGLRVREGARPGALPRRRADPRAVQEGVRRRQPAQGGGSTTSPLFLDFLEGKRDFPCTAWGIPRYSLFGWQRPCYLMGDGYVPDVQGADRGRPTGTRYGRGKDARCDNCMAHCGYEPTAVLATMGSLRESIRAFANT